VEVRVTANAFLRRMVRSIVALLLAAGRGRLAPEAVDALLAGRGRALDGRAAPPHGLTLERVIYTDSRRNNEIEERAAASEPARRNPQRKTGEQGT
jgi:tRNA pseudouridine38-40 synthase